MKRYFLILIMVSFLLTAIIGSAIINLLLGLEGSMKNIALAIEFFVFAWMLYDPIKKRFE